ncbi:unnamed protein product [Rotaria magnacalcarata]|uniref:Protein SYS1 homolog n=1 Tax=Rotaria magnacalcarata TaxID=392030 RepID=A0A816RS50_9BILA|nr:unnamed protein product [Rotaria magnacalcarata]CAF1259709.1 unnamed protein product [Rotaria magnacalcarata]CAF1920575.1 unnamed protein product [Rotaria magnacalcarata]CAF2076310.1 unnamed protein product [Rotaria magnacalcarata]CAF2077090.1 unnamed protein product [Rotaria magnacalcarata]
MNGFRYQKWDPLLIVSQIVAVQTLYYLGLGFWVLLITITIDRAPSLDYLFSYEIFNITNWSSRLFTGVFLLNALTSALAILYIVGRYKQCLDFSITIHFYHFIACWIYNSQCPRMFSWYLTQFFSIVIMTILSEHLSKKYELRTIPIASRVDL